MKRRMGGSVSSQYDSFWLSRKEEIARLLKEACASGESSGLNVGGLAAHGRRQSWYGCVEVSSDGRVRSEQAHGTALGRMIVRERLLPVQGDVSLTLRISNRMLLSARRSKPGLAPTAAKPRTGDSDIPLNKHRAAPFQRRAQLAGILGKLPYEAWMQLVHQAPVWTHGKVLLARYAFGPFCTTMVTVALDDFALKGTAESGYWARLAELLKEGPTPRTQRDLRNMLVPFYSNERFHPLKLDRLSRFLNSSLAGRLWVSSPSDIAGGFQRTWAELASTMRQRGYAKTVCLAMKFLGCGLWMVGEDRFEWGNISIPVDLRVQAFAARAGLCERATDAQVRWAFRDVVCGLSSANPKLIMIHLDSLVWRIAAMSGTQLRDYFGQLGAEDIGLELAQFLGPVAIRAQKACS